MGGVVGRRGSQIDEDAPHPLWKGFESETRRLGPPPILGASSPVIDSELFQKKPCHSERPNLSS